MKKKTNITHEFVEAAIRRFLKNGGLIQELPIQQSTRRVVVGAHHGAFENPIGSWNPDSPWIIERNTG